ncbi:hypothetical protein EDD30_0937 [Couchioplanes caeruleus]|uniref:Uncharacterized protein n=1 Tax=Couchioplanes caeruleus TaxID=56438 RepID=A0A3N1GD59_9ACTN|nr:hypothetical protein EDD30_0937 [Couchioplanes caeruleus]
MVSDQRLVWYLTAVPGTDTSRRHLRSLLTSPSACSHRSVLARIRRRTTPCPHC